MFSVWNQHVHGYDYYESAGRSARPGTPQPRHLRTTSRHGTHPEAAAWPLPANAEAVGRGLLPRGFIASPRNGLGGLGALPFDLTGPNLVVLGVVAFIAYQYWWKERT